jgi:hypothetical protein
MKSKKKISNRLENFDDLFVGEPGYFDFGRKNPGFLNQARSTNKSA